jgi:3-oxoacyl-[acyl-carrier protein] reductase
MNFAGQTVLVTGASRGIGLAIAEAFLADGADVIGTATRLPGQPVHPHLKWIQADFSERGQLDALRQKIDSMQRVDVLVNNAGVNRITAFAGVTDAQFTELFDIDVRAPYLLSQAAAKVMTTNGGGRIVNIASIWSVVTKTKRSLYTTAKSGLVGMTRALAVELAEHNILVNAVSPGFVLTDLTRSSLTPPEMTQLTSEIPLQRMAQPAEIANCVRFLCSQENSYITGQNIVIDGGFTLR